MSYKNIFQISRVSGCHVAPHSLIDLSIGPIWSLLKVTAAHHRKPDQGEGCSHTKVIASYIIPCSFRAWHFLVVTASYMTTEISTISIELSLNKAHILKTHTIFSSSHDSMEKIPPKSRGIPALN